MLKCKANALAYLKSVDSKSSNVKEITLGLLLTATADASKAAEEIPLDVATTKPSGRFCKKCSKILENHVFGAYPREWA